MSRISLLLLVLCCAYAVPVLAGNYADTDASRFGAAAIMGVATYAPDLGSHYARLPFTVDETNYHATFNMNDGNLQMYQDSGVVAYGIINPAMNSAWLTPSQFAQAVTSIVERFDGDGNADMPGLKHPIRVWEFCNEFSTRPGTQGYDGLAQDSFVALMTAARSALTAACPACSFAYNPFDTAAAIALVGSIGAAGIDIVSYHTYSPLDFPQTASSDYYVLNFPALLASVGLSGKPTWATEYAFYEHGGATPDTITATQTDNARWWAQTSAYGFGSNLFHKVIYAEIVPPNDGTANLKWMALVDTAGTKRRIYYGFRKMAELLDGFDTATPVSVGANLYGYRFGVGYRNIHVYWCTEGTADQNGVVLTGFKGSSVRIVSAVSDDNGNFDTHGAAVAGGSVTLDLTTEPVYVIDQLDEDLDTSGSIDVGDLDYLNRAYGSASGDGTWDAGCNFVTSGASGGRIDFEDVAQFAARYGISIR